VGSRRPETIVKRAREQALREKRERKQAKKDARAVAKLAGEEEVVGEDEAGEGEGSDVEALVEESGPQSE
jgi:hypothetical protein